MRPGNGEGFEAGSDEPPKTHENEHADCAVDRGADQDGDDDRKRFMTLRARLALRGYSLHELSCDGYLIARWNLTRCAPDLRAVSAFLRAVVGGAA